MSASEVCRPNPMQMRFAEDSDAAALSQLVNAVFIVERPIFDGDRISPKQVNELMRKGKFLIVEDSTHLAGNVYVEVRGNRGYIGLLSVDPSLQGSGLGRLLMNAAEEHFRRANCIAADLCVLSPRAPLPAFYRHLGYTETHTSTLPAELHPKIPCHYIHMSKPLSRQGPSLAYGAHQK